MISSTISVATSSPRIALPASSKAMALGAPARGRRVTAGANPCVEGSGMSIAAFGAYVPAFTTQDAVAGVRAWSPPV